MYNTAILGLIDFENWNNQDSISMGGSTGVIKSILPYISAENIYLLGITSDKKKLNNIVVKQDNVIIIPIIYVPKGTKIPTRILAFWYSRKINSVLDKYNIRSVYSHAEEMSYWVNSNRIILYHVHGSSNAIEIAKNKLFRNFIFIKLWEYLRNENLRKATRIIAIDQKCHELAKKQQKEKETILMPNFVDTNIYFVNNERSEFISQIKENILLFVGRIEEVKGLELFVDTVIELNKGVQSKWKGVFVGFGTYSSTIETYINKLAANDLFNFTGPVYKESELRSIYNQASVLMISSHTEGIPMVILESLACGTPVVSTDVGGIKEFISDNKMCFVNEQRNPFEFANLVHSAMKNKNYFIKSEFRFSVQNASTIINQILSS